ncbi:AzlD domain-containing protein [Micromonospora inyonensis]|uniref:Branched-chain amino acid transport protein (AzlD) n=1 Tax=Micromonospora inyonensis TaxID=47866 RepID=A0A1C6S4S8_9ACTN|nr:AzlD domain-containing protein [Micromonospora inyonensis]SCL24498.1 Branched-chain amino acid transport protein (AzlD) [Micromonospora inyonensis]
MWTAILLGTLGVYLLKLAGLAVPRSVLEKPQVEEASAVLPVALLAALVAVQTFATGGHLVLDARAAGFAVALVAVLLRAPFLLVVALGAGTAALLRLLT